MKKLMLTTAIASVLATAAIAQTSITGEIRVSYKDVSMDKGALGVGAGTKADRNYGFGAEQQVNFRNAGKLNVGGLDYVAGFSMENDGEQTGTLFNENMYIDLTNASLGTTISFSRDHIQRSDSDRSAANLVGYSPNELTQTCNSTDCGTRFSASVGAAPGTQFGAALLQKTPVGIFSGLFVPNNASRSAGTATVTASSSTPTSAVTGVPVVNGDTVGLAASENVNPNTTAAYEIGFVGDLTVKGLEVHYFKNENNDFANTWSNGAVKAKGQNYGVKYNMGQFTAGVNKKKGNKEAATLSETEELHYGLAMAVNKELSIGLTYAKAELTGSTIDQKVKAVQLGYALGPVDLTVAYSQGKDQLSIAGNDVDVLMTRLIGRF